MLTQVNGDIPATRRIANRPIVCHAVEHLAEVGVEQVAVVAPGASIAGIRSCLQADLAADIAITYLAQGDRADLLGALRATAAFVGDDPAVVHLADGLVGQHLGEVTTGFGEDPPDLLLLLHRTEEARDGLEPGTQRLLGLTELNGSRSRLALAGVCLFGPAALHHTIGTMASHGPGVDFVSIAEHLATEGRNLGAGIVGSWRRYQGDPLDLLELNRLVLDQQAAQPEPFDRGDNRIEGRVVIAPSAEVHASIILGPCIIGPRAHVTSSYIGPYTAIGADSEIEGAEIVRSIVAEGARIKHIGGRIEASTIGPRASIFRDFGLPQAMRLHVGEGVEVALN
jgi:glucose-1-phosphate thymidylyltransferase